MKVSIYCIACIIRYPCTAGTCWFTDHSFKESNMLMPWVIFFFGGGGAENHVKLTTKTVNTENVFGLNIEHIFLKPSEAHLQNCKKWLLAPSCLPVYLSAWNNSAPIRRIFMKSDIGYFWKICEEHSICVVCNALMIISRSVLRTKNVSGKTCRKSQNTHFMCVLFEYRALYEAM